MRSKFCLNPAFSALTIALSAMLALTTGTAFARGVGEAGVSTAQGVDAAPGIETRVWALPEANSMRFTVKLTNESGAPQRLTFKNAKHIKVVVRDDSGSVVWSSSQPAFAATAAGPETISVNATGSFGSMVLYSVIWTPNSFPSGELHAEFKLLLSRPITLGTLAFSR